MKTIQRGMIVDDRQLLWALQLLSSCSECLVPEFRFMLDHLEPSSWLPWRQTHLPCPLSSKELVQPTVITFNSEIKCCNISGECTPGSHHDRNFSIFVVTITVVSSVISSDFLKKKTCEVQAFLRAIQLYRQDRGRYEAWDMLIGSDVRVRRVLLT